MVFSFQFFRTFLTNVFQKAGLACEEASLADPSPAKFAPEEEFEGLGIAFLTHWTNMHLDLTIGKSFHV